MRAPKACACVFLFKTPFAPTTSLISRFSARTCFDNNIGIFHSVNGLHFASDCNKHDCSSRNQTSVRYFWGQWWDTINMLDLAKILYKCSFFSSSGSSTPFLGTHRCKLHALLWASYPPYLSLHQSGYNSLSPHQLLLKVSISCNSPSSWSKPEKLITASAFHFPRWIQEEINCI